MKSILQNSFITSIIYCILGVAWILFSDELLFRSVVSLELYKSIESIKGVLFVICSSVIIFFLTYFLYKKNFLSVKNHYKAQQELLKKSERRFKALVENTEEIIALINKEGNIMYISPAFERITGYKTEDIIGKQADTIMHPEQAVVAKIIFENLLRNPYVIMHLMNRFICKNGNHINVEGTITNLLHDENVQAIVWNYRDVTKKKLIEKQAAFNHNNLKALINNTKDLMWSVDRNFNLITSNKAFDEIVEHLLGKSIEKEKSVLDIGFKQDRLDRFKSYYERAFCGESFTEVEHNIEPDEFWAEISFYPIYNDGEIVGTACFSRDITRAKQGEMRLTEFTNNLIEVKNQLEYSEFKLKQAQAIAHVGSWELDFESGVALWSDENCRIYGLSPKKNRQRYEDWKSFIHPGDVRRVIKNLEEAHNKLIPASYHYRIVRRDGTVRYVYTITRFNFNAKGETVSLYGVTYDETESKIAEIQLAEYTDNLLKIKNQLEYSEFKLKQAQAIARVGSWERNYKDNSIIWSDENCRIYGVSLQENKQTFESWKSFVHSEDLENTLQILENAHKTLTPATLYYRIVRKDGAVRYVYTITQFTYNETGKAVSLYGVTLDVTEQKLTELEILKKNEELRNLSNHIQHVREEERKLVSRDLHDELGQQLTALKMEINWIISNATGADEEMVLRLKQVLQFSDDLISTIRRILADLRPAIIDDLGLVAALEWKCDDFMEKSGVECKFISSIDERVFRDDFSINVYRILQEALTNVIRYAEAKLVTVIVHEDKQNLFLEISDDGKGFCTESIKNGKTLGILGMKERAALFDGDLEVIGMPNKGTSIKLKIPLI